MNDLDPLIEKLVPLRKRAVDSLSEKHPHIFSIINKYFEGKENHTGIIVTENGVEVGRYTFYLKGLYIDGVKSGMLSSEIHHPFGVIKPYGIIEKSVIEKMLEDEQSLINEPFSTILRYLPDITVKFIR